MKKEKRSAKRRPEFPVRMRFSSLEERGRFYSTEFSAGRAGAEIGRGFDRTVFAVILGRYSRIFPREYSRIADNTVFIEDAGDSVDLREYVLQYLPEGVYYDRNIYSDKKACASCGKNHADCWGCEGFLGQELAIDLDVENVYCPLHGNLDQRMARNDQLSFCEYDLLALKENLLELLSELRTEFGRMRVTYSGRGYHVHVLDAKAFKMPKKERKEFADQIVDRYPIDEWVTEGESHLMRLPFSLNALVSRIVLPLRKKELEGFDPITDKRCIPGFIRDKMP